MRQMAAEMAKKKENIPTNAVDSLFNKVSSLIEQARVRVATAMNVAEVYTKYQIGRLIVDDEQKGQYRAEYGKQILLNLSERLISRYEGGWTVDTLKRCQKRRLPMQELKDVVEKLRNDVPLEEKFQDHELSGIFSKTSTRP